MHLCPIKGEIHLQDAADYVSGQEATNFVESREADHKNCTVMTMNRSPDETSPIFNTTVC
jgi:hypothetical protein